MPKMKTSSAAKKRFKKLSSGLIKKSSAYKRHLLTKKTKSRKRGLRKAAYINGVDAAKIKKLLPNNR